MRDFAAWLSSKKAEKAGPSHLRDFLEHQLATQNLKRAGEAIEGALDCGKAIVLLDGLDEIANRDARARIRQNVAAFINRYRDSRHVVTCRRLVYQDDDARLPGLQPFEIAPFDRPKIARFIDAWYTELERARIIATHAESEELKARLRQAVERPDLQRLAPNPLLLTVMAIVNAHKGRLPDARALVYKDVVALLLWRWDEKKTTGGDEPPLRERSFARLAGTRPT